MPAEIVVDASVAAKAFLTEEVGSEAAVALIFSGLSLIAPEFVLAELANVAVTKVRRGDIERQIGARMAKSARELFAELACAADLSARAFELAVDHGLSAYDALYVALAEARGCALVTADVRLINRVREAGLDIAIRTP